MKYIIWDEEHSNPVNDAHVRAEGQRLVNLLKSQDEVYIGQAAVLNELRLAVQRGDLHWAEVELVVNKAPIKISKHGALARWPNELCTLDEQLHELLSVASKRLS